MKCCSILLLTALAGKKRANASVHTAPIMDSDVDATYDDDDDDDGKGKRNSSKKSRRKKGRGERDIPDDLFHDEGALDMILNFEE